MFDGRRSDLGVGLGTGHLRDDRQCRETVRQALELGYRHVDTARAYGNERSIGAAIEAADVPREELFLATKVDSRNLGYDDVLASVDASRDALGVETVDLVYAHWPAHAYNADETLPALADLRERGATCHVGLGNVTVDVLEEARQATAAPVSAVQVEMHPLLQQAELLAYTRRHDVALVAHTPLGQGEVVGLPVLSSIAEKHDVTEAQVALAWLLGRDGVVAVPGARGDHLEENRRARSLDLDGEDVRRIESIERRRRFVDYEFAPWNDP